MGCIDWQHERNQLRREMQFNRCILLECLQRIDYVGLLCEKRGQDVMEMDLKRREANFNSISLTLASIAVSFGHPSIAMLP